MSNADTDYRPSYIFVHDGGKRHPAKNAERGILRFDFMVITTKIRRSFGDKIDVTTAFYSAWGDGAHVKQSGIQFNGGEVQKTDVALHVGQIEELFNKAYEVSAFLGRDMVYHDKLDGDFQE